MMLLFGDSVHSAVNTTLDLWRTSVKMPSPIGRNRRGFFFISKINLRKLNISLYFEGEQGVL